MVNVGNKKYTEKTFGNNAGGSTYTKLYRIFILYSISNGCDITTLTELMSLNLPTPWVNCILRKLRVNTVS